MWWVSLSFGRKIMMILYVVSLLQSFETFHRVINNSVFRIIYFQTSTLNKTRYFFTNYFLFRCYLLSSFEINNDQISAGQKKKAMVVTRVKIYHTFSIFPLYDTLMFGQWIRTSTCTHTQTFSLHPQSVFDIMDFNLTNWLQKWYHCWPIHFGRVARLTSIKVNDTFVTRYNVIALESLTVKFYCAV